MMMTIRMLFVIPGKSMECPSSPSVQQTFFHFLEQQLVDHASLRPAEMAERITQEFGISVHPRSIERALSRRRKKGR